MAEAPIMKWQETLRAGRVVRATSRHGVSLYVLEERGPDEYLIQYSSGVKETVRRDYILIPREVDYPVSND